MKKKIILCYYKNVNCCLFSVDSRTSKSQCHPNPCQNAGTCHENGPGYDCYCATGFKGPHCESMTRFSF